MLTAKHHNITTTSGKQEAGQGNKKNHSTKIPFLSGFMHFSKVLTTTVHRALYTLLGQFIKQMEKENHNEIKLTKKENCQL